MLGRPKKTPKNCRPSYSGPSNYEKGALEQGFENNGNDAGVAVALPLPLPKKRQRQLNLALP